MITEEDRKFEFALFMKSTDEQKIIMFWNTFDFYRIFYNQFEALQNKSKEVLKILDAAQENGTYFLESFEEDKKVIDKFRDAIK